MSPGPVFVALVNPKSGGNVGASLLARFRENLDPGRVYNLAEEGPKRALEEHWGKPNLRIIGRRSFISHRIESGPHLSVKSIWSVEPTSLAGWWYLEKI